MYLVEVLKGVRQVAAVERLLDLDYRYDVLHVPFEVIRVRDSGSLPAHDHAVNLAGDPAGIINYEPARELQAWRSRERQAEKVP